MMKHPIYRQRLTWILLAVAVGAMAIPMTFQNCGEGFAVRQLDAASMAYGGVIRRDCMESFEAQACLFFKNPVAQKGAPAGDDELPGLQLLGVELTGLDSSGYLKNANFEVSSSAHGRAHEGSNGWKFQWGAAGGENLPQVMAYYWAQVTIEEIETVLGGPSALSGKGLKILTDANYTGYSVAENTIYLSRGSSGVKNHSLSGEVLIHLLMEAHLRTSSGGGAYDLTGDTHHRDCGPTEGPVFSLECCVDTKGCSKAITAGLADFWVARMFPEMPTVGEALAQNAGGLNHCGLSRNLNSFANLTVNAAYSACQTAGFPGQVYSMGTAMGSIWFEVWKQAHAQGRASEIEELFFEVQKSLKGSDTFLTFLTKIQDADQRLFSGLWSDRFVQEYARRGIN
ncbi:MAG: hypothetical protein IT288_11965 [Bdellovibrionales bacterium]|nr:hypothetical protein [Bdellovibrionales bacterium]